MVEFVNGGNVAYLGVEQSVADALVGAESVGSYFSKNIKGKYEFLKAR